ncbi:hypothetical protein GCM10020000_66580 [Streptomyces olivoverticillatus]
MIIDPGHQAAEGVEEALRKHRLKPVAVVLTHGHIDHVASVVPVCGAHDVPAWIHPADRFMMSDPEKALGRSIGQQLMGELTVGGSPTTSRSCPTAPGSTSRAWSSPSRTRPAIPRGR